MAKRRGGWRGTMDLAGMWRAFRIRVVPVVDQKRLYVIVFLSNFDLRTMKMYQ
jgi:hypothetical protein